MITINELVIIIWAAYWLYSIAAAITTRMSVKKIARGETLLERVIQNGLMVVALYFIYSPYLGFLAARIIPEYAVLMIFGCILVMGSLFFADWSRRILAANWSSAVQSVENQKLVQHGPYRFIRHPIYTGVTVAFLGTFFVQGTLASLVALLCIAIKYALKIRKEEQFLHTLFGTQYTTYKNDTWAMLPFLY